MENLPITASAPLTSAGTGQAATEARPDAAAAELVPLEFRALLIQQIKDLVPTTMPASATGKVSAELADLAAADPASSDAAVTEADATNLPADPAILFPPAIALLPAAQPPGTPVPGNVTYTAGENAAAGLRDNIPDIAGAAAKTGTAAGPGRDTSLVAAQTGAGRREALPQFAERATESTAGHHDTGGAPSSQVAFAQSLPAPPVTATAIANAQPQIHTPLGATGWNTELGQTVMWMVNDKQQVAELRVNPPDLGPLEIRLTIDDHQTTAIFTSPHSAVREAVESALPRLREILAESGIMLGNASVTADSPRDGSAYTPPRQPAAAAAEPVADPLSGRAQHLATAPARGRGLVDLFA